MGLKLDWLEDDNDLRLDWRDLLVIVEQGPSESASARRHREGWTDLALLLAQVNDTLAILAWQQTADGEKGRNYPEPIPRPGVKSSADKSTIGKSDGFADPDDLAAWYASRFSQN